MASARHQLASVRAHPLLLVGGVLQPTVLLVVVYFARSGSEGDITSIASAILLMSYWGSTVWQGAGILRRERHLGTLSPVMRGVPDPLVVLAGKSLGASALPVALMVVTLATVLGVLGAQVIVARPAWFLIGLACAVLSGTALGTLLCSLFLLTRFGNQLSGALLYPVFLLAGLLIPPDFFPAGIRWLGWFVSLRWAQLFLVSAAQGAADLVALGLLGLLTAGYAMAGVVAFRRVERLARSRGTLELG